MKTQALLLMILASFAMALVGCDIGVNPLLFDGAALEATFNATSQTMTPETHVVNLQEVVESIKDEIDSIDVVNISLLIDNTAGNSATTFSGTATINGQPLVELTDVQIAAFFSERSIFQRPLPYGLRFFGAGVGELRRALNNRNASPTATFVLTGSTNNPATHFTAHVKVYTQIYTKAKK